ncbi:MAG: hypothetical protein ACRDHZ_02805 [Ktedonobacteraceae bacterium]
MPHLHRSLLRRYRLFAPRLLRIGLVLLVLLLLCDGIAAQHLPQIQAALTLNIPKPLQQGGIARSGISLEEQQTVLASDTFQRTDQAYWGTSSSGQSWLADAQTDRNFAVSHAAGLVNAAPDCSDCEAILGPVVADVEVRFSAALTSYNASALCAILRWNDANNLYKMELDGQTLTVWRVMDGMATPLQSIAFPARAGALYTFRFQAVGSQLSAMAWPADQPSPTAWQISVLDSALNAGQAGIGVLVQHEAQAKITAYQEVAL